jgi:hypothetical protein
MDGGYKFQEFTFQFSETPCRGYIREWIRFNGSFTISSKDYYLSLCRSKSTAIILMVVVLPAAFGPKSKYLSFFDMDINPLNSPFAIKGFAYFIKDYHGSFILHLYPAGMPNGLHVDEKKNKLPLLRMGLIAPYAIPTGFT